MNGKREILLKKKLVIPVIAGIAIGIMALSVSFSFTEPKPEIISKDFSYESNSDIQKAIEPHGILMSNPLKIQGDSIDEFCMFFGDDTIQEKIEYCTSTELKDSSGNFLGNVHMVGDAQSPQTILAIFQSDPFISQGDEIVLVIDSVIDTTVCDCWEQVKPGGFSSVGEWVEAAKVHHLEAKRTTSKSEISGLAQKEIILEITTNTEGYLWKFLVDKS